ncbi:MAG: Gfo/Idh/MocA family protein [Opitutales bacterium]
MAKSSRKPKSRKAPTKKRVPATGGKKPIKAAVVGYGGAFNMGRAHLTLMKQAGMEPTAVVELDPERLKIAEEDFPGIQTYTSVADMLKKSDAETVTIITPHNTHAKLAVQCLKAGRHVVTEKPFAITTAECDRMIAEAKKQQRVLSTYHNRHWDGWILKAVEQIVDKQAIGEVFRVECNMGGYGQPGDAWRSSKSISGGILYDWGVHLLEYALQVVRDDIMEVSGFNHTGFWTTRWGKDTNEDEAEAVVRFRKGAWIRLNVSHLAAHRKQARVEFYGTKGAYLMDFDKYTLIQKRKDGTTLTTTTDNPPTDYGPFYNNVADAIRGKAKLIITPEWARRPIHILDLAGKSAASGRAVRAKYA